MAEYTLDKFDYGGNTYIIEDNRVDGKVSKSGDTMTGQLKTSFNSSVAIGSYLSTTNTIPELCDELRYSSGAMGSVQITTAYTNGNITIPTGWYNFIWTPHRSGGLNGAANNDNCNYGSLYLSGMTISGLYMIRYASSTIVEVQNLYECKYWNYNSSTDSIDLVFPS